MELVDGGAELVCAAEFDGGFTHGIHDEVAGLAFDAGVDLFHLGVGHHAHAEGLVRSLVTRVSEALFVRKLVDAWIDADPNVALVVAGDFNDTEQSVAVRAVTGDLVLGAAQGGAVREGDAFSGRALTPCARAVAPEQRYSVAFRGSVAQIDHLLVSRALYARFVKAKFFNETLLEDLAAQGPGGVGSLASDHAPLRADFL